MKNYLNMEIKQLTAEQSMSYKLNQRANQTPSVKKNEEYMAY